MAVEGDDLAWVCSRSTLIRPSESSHPVHVFCHGPAEFPPTPDFSYVTGLCGRDTFESPSSTNYLLPTQRKFRRGRRRPHRRTRVVTTAAMSGAGTFINLPPAPSDPTTPSEIPSRSGTPNSTTTSMSELSTVAIKDGHRGHLPHQHGHAPSSGLSNQLDAERADRISRLAGLERVTTARNPSSSLGNTPLSSVATPPAQQPHGYFDASGNPAIARERSTVGSASATGSVGARTTWAGSEAGDADKMSESADQDVDMDAASSVGGYSEENGSLVGFGEGARTPARQSVMSSPSKSERATPTAREPRYIDGVTYDQDGMEVTGARASMAEQAERIVRENMNTTSADRMRGGSRPGDLGKFGFEK
nr:hypothetical protein CFP56_69510 [Quercus suber]